MTAPNRAMIESALGELGSTPQEVADTIQIWKVQATIADHTGCAVSEWLAQRLSAVKVSVSGDTCTVDGVSCDLPLPVVEFVEEFDDGGYPELVDPSAPLVAGWTDDSDDDEDDDD